MFGSYYQANYYQNPTPYDESDIGEPVPGWGTTRSVAGPVRVGVGATPVLLRTAMTRPMLTIAKKNLTMPATTTSGEASKPLPWYVWPIAAAVVLGGVGYLGAKQGWL